MTDDLCALTAAQAAARIRARMLSPVTLMRAVLDRAEGIQPKLNPFVALLHDPAMQAAEQAERDVADGHPLGPLHGVPVSIKDQVDLAGVPTTHGSAIFADNMRAADDVVVRRLRAAGAIPFAKTRLPEFGHKGLTDGPSFGTTRNPWDLSRTPGGSSGGAAAALACGAGPLALGTDGAGSIRIPAACCGVVGLKPTLGAIPWQQAVDAFGNYTYAGPMTRSVADAALMFEAMRGEDPSDPWTLGRMPPRPVSAALLGDRLDGLRIGVVMHMANKRVQRDYAADVEACLAVLTGRGAHAEPAGEDVDWIEHPGRVMYQANFAVSQRRHLDRWRDQMDPTLLAFMERGDAFSLTQFREGQYARTRLFRAIQGLFDRFDVLLTPTLTRTALPADFDAANDEVEIDGERCGITRQGWSAFVYPFNLTGHPALTVPAGRAADGLPTALQLVGPWGADMDLLRLGAIIEASRPWPRLAPLPAGG